MEELVKKVIKMFDGELVYDEATEKQQKRADLFASIDSVLAKGKKGAYDAATGQDTLFEDENEEDPIITAKPWTRLEMLRREKWALGVYLSGSPVDDLIASQENITRIEDINEVAYYKTIGEIIKVKPHVDRRGKTMAFLKLEDVPYSVDCVVFSDTYTRFANIIVSSNFCAVTGRYDGKSIIVDNFERLIWEES